MVASQETVFSESLRKLQFVLLKSRAYSFVAYFPAFFYILDLVLVS